MKRFIRYLYEYEQGRRTRNVGFVKVEQDEQECVVHVHGKGLRMGGQRKLGLYLFYESEDGCTGIWQGEIDNINPAVNYRLHYTREDVGEPENFDRINGVIMSNGDGRKYASVWSDMPVDVDRMQVWTQGMAPAEKARQMPGDADGDRPQAGMTPAEEDQQIPQAGMTPEEEDRQRPQAGMTPEEEDRQRPQAGMTPAEENQQMPQAGTVPTEEVRQMPEDADEERRQAGTAPAEEDRQMPQTGTAPAEEEQLRQEIAEERPQVRLEAKVKEEAGNDSPQPVRIQEAGRPVRQWKVTKIQRKELAKLPRCEWRLANNNFLLHGYYNYRHLVFIENERIMYLGVPGIYHEKEAEAAGAWGFPDFVPQKELEVMLSSDECEEEEQFGYWCRQVRHPFC